MGGLWVDYNLMSNVPGLFVLGEANFSDHGANRLGASALMQGLADGYFVISYTLANYLAGLLGDPVVPTDDPAFADAERSVGDTMARLLSINGTSSVDHYHRELGKIMWDYCGMARNRSGLEKAWRRSGAARGVLEGRARAGRPGAQPVAGEGRPRRRLLRAGELMVRDALHREGVVAGTSARRARPRTARRCDDEHFAYVAAWEWTGKGHDPPLHREPLEFEYVKLTQRLQVVGGAPSYGPDPASGGKADRRRDGWSPTPTRPGTSAPTCPSSRCSTS